MRALIVCAALMLARASEAQVVTCGWASFPDGGAGVCCGAGRCVAACLADGGGDCGASGGGGVDTFWLDAGSGQIITLANTATAGAYASDENGDTGSVNNFYCANGNTSCFLGPLATDFIDYVYMYGPNSADAVSTNGGSALMALQAGTLADGGILFSAYVAKAGNSLQMSGGGAPGSGIPVATFSANGIGVVAQINGTGSVESLGGPDGTGAFCGPAAGAVEVCADATCAQTRATLVDGTTGDVFDVWGPQRADGGGHIVYLETNGSTTGPVFTSRAPGYNTTGDLWDFEDATGVAQCKVTANGSLAGACAPGSTQGSVPLEDIAVGAGDGGLTGNSTLQADLVRTVAIGPQSTSHETALFLQGSGNADSDRTYDTLYLEDTGAGNVYGANYVLVSSNPTSAIPLPQGSAGWFSHNTTRSPNDIWVMGFDNNENFYWFPTTNGTLLSGKHFAIGTTSPAGIFDVLGGNALFGTTTDNGVDQVQISGTFKATTSNTTLDLDDSTTGYLASTSALATSTGMQVKNTNANGAGVVDYYGSAHYGEMGMGGATYNFSSPAAADRYYFYTNSTKGMSLINISGGDFRWWNSLTSSTPVMQLTNGGRLVMSGGADDGTNALQVNGNATVSDATTAHQAVALDQLTPALGPPDAGTVLESTIEVAGIITTNNLLHGPILYTPIACHLVAASFQTFGTAVNVCTDGGYIAMEVDTLPQPSGGGSNIWDGAIPCASGQAITTLISGVALNPGVQVAFAAANNGNGCCSTIPTVQATEIVSCP